ncbi:CarD family transcriptional regulator [Sporomusa sp.]|uniref:CarD family transcriptional regulator n=1 Tax=Sporomusa sp. TaxID=2078658 RepID=UPI002976914C|nr:CarD family transcriptional regulator [Sporomusa sp.]MDF2570258.1 carD [Sporomusa sp.]MDF2874885.1 carD [Sporomusa sp.]HWR05379.1 CarD family transcriptional regulator [Sporomusa sp.]
MFQVGDKIFYPAQGGGIIQTIEEKEFLGETQLYYSINILHRNMQVMIPIDKTERLGIRRIVNPEKLDDVFTTFFDGESDTSCNDNQTDRRNMLKIKSGDIYEGAEVIRDLVRISNKKKLGMTKKNMLDNARQILLSEVVLVLGIQREQASDLLDQVINFHPA